MEKVKIGAITVGQSPRVDVTPDLWPIFGPNVELIEAGGLDGLSREEIEIFVPEEGDYVLVSRLKDGSSVTFAERYVRPACSSASTGWRRKGSGSSSSSAPGFPRQLPPQGSADLPQPDPLRAGAGPLRRQAGCCDPFRKAAGAVPEEVGRLRLGGQVLRRFPLWGDGGGGGSGREIAKTDADLVLLDCIGYTAEMKRMVAKITGKNVILSGPSWPGR